MEYQKQWEFLTNSFDKNTIGHAFLFSGDVERIKSFTKDFIKYTNCQSKKKPCNTCNNCVMIERQQFPDLLVVASRDSESSAQNEKDMMEITVKQVRSVQSFLDYKSYYGSIKAVIIEHAERMNIEAQNCFLKTLEEPKGQTLIFLLTSRSDLLLQTISSRCQQLKFYQKDSGSLTKEEDILIQSFKRIAAGDLAEKFNFAKSANLEGDNFPKILVACQKYFRGLLLENVQQGKSEQGYSLEKIKNILHFTEKLIYQANTANINQKLALEVLLMEVS